MKWLLALFLPLFLLSCSDEFDSISFGDVPNGAFRYVGYHQGTAVVKGWLLFMNLDPQNVQGTHQLEAIGNPSVELGPQLGGGQFEGSIGTDGRLFINLNPGTSDNNVFLAGAFEGQRFESRLTGTWSYSGFAGVISEGTFVAGK